MPSIQNIKTYPPTLRHKYPHMAPNDVPIWEAFLTQHANLLTRVAYDVRIGQGVEIPAGTPENISKMAKDLSQLRIDALNITPSEIWIIEIKFDPSVSLVGQLVSYAQLFPETYPDTPPIKQVAIVNKISRDLDSILTQRGIQYFITPG